MRSNINKINKSNEYLLNNLTPDFLVRKLAPYIDGFKDVKFEGV